MRNSTRPFMSLRLLAAFFLGFAGFISAAPVQTPHVEAELVAEDTSIQPGRPFVVALRLKMEQHWHTYWQNPGDSGLATTLDWKLPNGFKAGPIQWPYPKRLPLEGLVNYGYEDEVFLLTEITPPATLVSGTVVELAARADWLVCMEVCIPGGADLKASLPVKADKPEPDERWAKAFTETQKKFPARSDDWNLRAERIPAGYRLVAEPAKPGAIWPGEVHFFATDEGVVEPSKPQPFAVAGERRTITLSRSINEQNAPERLRGVLVAQGAWSPGIQALAVDEPIVAGSASAVKPAPDKSGWLGFLGAAVTAFIGGLILNLMPCVFPILSIKILGFVQHAGKDRAKVALHGWAFTLGVLVSFWALAGALLFLRAGGSQLGWGYQLQSPVFVLILCFTLFAFALTLFGVYEIGGGIVGAAGRVSTGHGLMGAFLNGVLATVLATPCTAPFMGTALAFAFTQPAARALAVFTVLGVGMAAPYLVLSLKPAWLKFLPRPGPWMDTFKQLMAFPLLGTIVWLLWVLGFQTGVDGMMRALAGLLVFGAALWVWGRWGALGRAAGTRKVAAVSTLTLTLAAVALAWNAAAQMPGPGASSAESGGIAWEKFTLERLAQLQTEKRPVFIDFSAAWCASCIVNERLVIDSDRVRLAFAAKKVVMLKADWTRRDEVITRALAGYGKTAVPLHVLYDGRASQPVLVRDLVTQSEILEALDKLP